MLGTMSITGLSVGLSRFNYPGGEATGLLQRVFKDRQGGIMSF